MGDFPIVDLTADTTPSDVTPAEEAEFWKSEFDRMERAFEMAVEALEVIADERGIDDPMFRQFSAMCRIVARSARKMVEGA